MWLLSPEKSSSIYTGRKNHLSNWRHLHYTALPIFNGSSFCLLDCYIDLSITIFPVCAGFFVIYHQIFTAKKKKKGQTVHLCYWHGNNACMENEMKVKLNLFFHCVVMNMYVSSVSNSPVVKSSTCCTNLEQPLASRAFKSSKIPLTHKN